MIQLIAQIEKSFKKHLPPATLFQAPTIAQLADILVREPSSESWSSQVPIQPRGSRIPFFWIHGDHSNAFLPRYLGPDQPFYGIEHQSQDGQPARYDLVDSIAAHHLKGVQSVQAKGPYFLGGYSFGAVVAFEMANQLRQQGEEVEFLFLLDPPDPILKGTSSRMPGVRIKTTKIHAHRSKIKDHLRQLSVLGTKQKLAYILVRADGRIQNAMSQCKSRIVKIIKKIVCKFCLASGFSLPTSMRSFYILGIYSRALQRYTPRPYAGQAILVRTKTRSIDYPNNWSRLITGGVVLYEVAGDHMVIRQEPYARHWAETLGACLTRAQAKNSPQFKTKKGY